MFFGWLMRRLATRAPRTDPRHDLGRRGEALAATTLQRKGLTIVARNWRCRAGEIDLIAQDRDSLIFIEVKTRADLASDPEDRVDEAKRRQVRRVAAVYLTQLQEEPLVRFDVVAVVLLPGRGTVGPAL